jgi:hypothetical protein
MRTTYRQSCYYSVKHRQFGRNPVVSYYSVKKHASFVYIHWCINLPTSIFLEPSNIIVKCITIEPPSSIISSFLGLAKHFPPLCDVLAMMICPIRDSLLLHSVEPTYSNSSILVNLESSLVEIYARRYMNRTLTCGDLCSCPSTLTGSPRIN